MALQVWVISKVKELFLLIKPQLIQAEILLRYRSKLEFFQELSMWTIIRDDTFFNFGFVLDTVCFRCGFVRANGFGTRTITINVSQLPTTLALDIGTVSCDMVSIILTNMADFLFVCWVCCIHVWTFGGEVLDACRHKLGKFCSAARTPSYLTSW